MAKYCVEKYERIALGEGENQGVLGEEVRVCWREDKHNHDASTITDIKKYLGRTLGGTWEVRPGSYQSNQSKCPQNSIEY